MAFGDFAERVHYDITHLYRLYEVYQNIKFKVGDKYERFCNLANGLPHVLGDKLVYINPRVFYAGKDADKAEILESMFKDRRHFLRDA